MGDKVVPVGSLAIHLDIACHGFLWRLEASSGLALVCLELHGILCDGTWWQSLVQDVV